MMAIGNRVNGAKIQGSKSDLNAEDESLLGPGGLKIACDYRSVLAEVLSCLMGNYNLHP